MTDRWAHLKDTAPYPRHCLSCIFLFIKETCLFFDEQGVPDQDVRNRVISLAGVDFLDDEALLSYDMAVGHSFIPSPDINDHADREPEIRNILFGLDDHRKAKETISTMINVFTG